MLLLGLTWSFENSLQAVLACALGVVLIVLIANLAALIVNRREAAREAAQIGPKTLRAQQDITEQLESLREGASAVSAIWSGEYDPGEVKRYFEDERKALQQNNRLHIVRVINPSVVPDEHFDFELLHAIHDEFGDRFRLLEDSTLRSYELYLAEYPRESDKKAVAVVVLNNTFSNRPEVALVLDPEEDQSLEGAVGAVKNWWATISDGLPGFDPVGLERWEHIAASYTRLVTKNVNDIEFLDRYSTRESEMVGAYLQSVHREGHELSVIEVGCGDGRALLDYIPIDLARHVAYVIGLDYARAMVVAAAGELKRLQQLSALASEYSQMLKSKTAFLQLNAEYMRSFFDDGRLRSGEQLLEAAPSAGEISIDPSNYATSTKVFCCLLNTIGVISPGERRVAFVEAMLSCLGVNDSLIFTVFAAERFKDEARTLYGELEEMINAEVTDVQFDFEQATFEVAGTPGYYSHWFTRRELHRLINDATERLEVEGRRFDSVKVDEMGSGGYFVAVRRMG
ncbi:MAG TPA: hypothetical protein VFX85_03005 [Solirubrobacterales bacterium]|nr:hypothetical protein [Solirubrobacterales bacterium]